MIKRLTEAKVMEALRYFPAVAIIGPRQVGKTTLLKQIQKKYKKPSIYLDLEKRSDYDKLDDPETFLRQYERQLVIIDEVQRKNELFPELRSLIDEHRNPGRFVLLGSASPELIKNSSESLAGRIAYIELSGLNCLEVPANKINELWLRGGFPDAFLKKIPVTLWMENFIRTYLEQDLPSLGFTANRPLAHRLWTMLSHNHGNLINYSDLSRSLELSSKTVKRHVDFLEHTFLVRQLKPFHANLGKRLVKSPKIYLRDSGMLHHLLDIETNEQLISHIKLGASWEGFVIEQITALLGNKANVYFYRTHEGAELDLVIEKKGKLLAGIEIKFGSNVKPSRGNMEAVSTLKTKQNFIIIREEVDYMINNNFRTCGLRKFLITYLPGLLK